ncbi:RloB family protein [Pseudomonas congelans]|uniref:RloB family protein n=1 Tax=Pseudomonas congelans TaxID=200452 RepID=UPI0016566FE7|nr:RloB family protein [Pseudomonas congelans]MBC8801194.1 RloB domain-containing protein [Pseudomonas congelans]
MGSDDLFHRRKARAKDLRRKLPRRQRYEKVLIVCEGEKTEPLYFSEIKDHYEIDTANIRISGDCGSAPISVVHHGEALYLEEARCGEPFDKVFCVFDQDQHSSFDDALRKISAMKPAGVFRPIYSVPCFEFWLLLHFIYTSSPFVADGRLSSSALLIKELQNYIPDYKKATENLFTTLLDQLDMAIAYATRLEQESQQVNSKNPYTNVHELVSYLRNIKAE